MMLPAPVVGPSAWQGAELAKSEEWIRHFSDDERRELDTALSRVRGRDLLTIGRADFPLPALGPVLDDIHRELLHGRGFVLLRGLAADRYDLRDLATIYWGLGTYLGAALPQNGAGHVLGHVRDVGRDEHDPNARIYQTTKRQNYHTDSCDIVGLLCVRRAKTGGLSSIVSSVTA
jgi:hypothetical protein